jgi:hypothetical protein
MNMPQDFTGLRIDGTDFEESHVIRFKYAQSADHFGSRPSLYWITILAVSVLNSRWFWRISRARSVSYEAAAKQSKMWWFWRFRESGNPKALEQATEMPDPEPADRSRMTLCADVPITAWRWRSPALKSRNGRLCLLPLNWCASTQTECSVLRSGWAKFRAVYLEKPQHWRREVYDNRVFNTPIQEAFIVGSTIRMSAVGLPIVEVQFRLIIYGLVWISCLQVSRSCYLSEGKWPVSMDFITSTYRSLWFCGPYHLVPWKVWFLISEVWKSAYPSNGVDLKGLMKAAYYDPNCSDFEHIRFVLSKVKGTKGASLWTYLRTMYYLVRRGFYRKSGKRRKKKRSVSSPTEWCALGNERYRRIRLTG